MFNIDDYQITSNYKYNPLSIYVGTYQLYKNFSKQFQNNIITS